MRNDKKYDKLGEPGRSLSVFGICFTHIRKALQENEKIVERRNMNVNSCVLLGV